MNDDDNDEVNKIDHCNGDDDDRGVTSYIEPMRFVSD